METGKTVNLRKQSKQVFLWYYTTYLPSLDFVIRMQYLLYLAANVDQRTAVGTFSFWSDCSLVKVLAPMLDLILLKGLRDKFETSLTFQLVKTMTLWVQSFSIHESSFKTIANEQIILTHRFKQFFVGTATQVIILPMITFSLAKLMTIMHIAFTGNNSWSTNGFRGSSGNHF